MKRTKKNKTNYVLEKPSRKADFILTADWHLMESSPVARLDKFTEETQWKKLDFIKQLAKLHDCPVIHSGDLFDYWKPSPALLSKTIQHLPEKFISCYGNHDLPQHNADLIHKCGLFTLETAMRVNSEPYPGIQLIHWGMEPFKNEDYIAVWHVMTYQGKEPWPGCTAPKAAKLLRKYPQFDLILTGDNHKPFVEEYEGRLLVNPGSIFRLTAAQIDHRPRVYLYYADTNTVEPVYLPIEKDVISREHIEIVEERENRIEAFISTLNEDWEAEMSFEDNLEKFKNENNVRTSVMDIIYKSIE